jgi:hypothetical protein
MREWSDSTGKFKIVASLVEVKNGEVYLKTRDGKPAKVAIARLSKVDRDYLDSDANPFQELSSDSTPSKANSAKPEPAPSTSTSATSGRSSAAKPDGPAWSGNLTINWDDVTELDRSFDGEWKIDLPDQSDLGFTPKRATLPKKSNFHEDVRRLEVDPVSKRAVAGYTVSFSVPKPLSRLSLIDLPTGKTINTGPVECDMCPMCVLNDGTTVLMYGTSDERKGFETPDQIQLWRVNGKKVDRSATWIPFPNDTESWGKKSNGHLAYALSLPNNRLIMLSNSGHLVCVDAVSRKPYWHSRLSGNFGVDATLDRRLLAVLDGHSVMLVDPQEGKVICAQAMIDKPHLGWPRIRISPSGKRLLVTFINHMRVLDLTKGEWIHESSFPNGAPIAPNALSYPHDDFALLDNRVLVHIPTQIKVCEYRDITRIASLGGINLVSRQENESGVVLPLAMPHPAAEKTLAQAKDDPSVFLIHPGVNVSIDASGTGEHASKVQSFLQSAAQSSGYNVVPNAPISIVAAITGPKQEAISYIARGSYIANVFQSNIRIVWQGKDVWTTGGNNIPGFLQTSRDESIQDKLNELGKTPNFYIFEKAQFPKMLQRPSQEDKNPNRSEALLTSRFTLQGFVDAK